ncbi:MAG: ABC transporter permease [Caldilineaceae bacterium]|nr:ABC transporter permease [Caldilineaceae bacterium]
MGRTKVGFLQVEYLYRLISLLSPLLFLLLWEGLVRLGWLDYRFFPPPSTVLTIFGRMIASGELWGHLSISLFRVLAGFVVGALPAVVLGLLMGWFRALYAFFDPIIAATHPVPKIALLPLFLILFGLGETTKIATIAVAVFFLVLITTVNGVRLVEPVLIEAAQSYGAKGWRLFYKVILPATLPAIFTGLRLGLGVALLVIVGAEFVAANKGIGYLIWISWSTLAVNKMYVGLVTIALLGMLTTNGLEWLRRRLMPWAQDFHGPR